jgi:microcystin-dependent protein
MNLLVPGAGTEPGPQFATDVNYSLTLIDSHDHTTGNGVPITSDALSITNTLPMNNNYLSSIRGLTLNDQQGVTPDSSSLYMNGSDLYWSYDGVTPVQITNGTSVAGVQGSIANLASPASATFVSAQKSFQWRYDAGKPAIMDSGPIKLQLITGTTNSITLQPPSNVSTYTMTLLPTPPASSFPILTMNTGGTMGSISPDQVGQGMSSVGADAIATTMDSTGANTIASKITNAAFIIPSGVIMPYMGTALPTGWLWCDGTSYLRTDYPTLFATVGTASGAADPTHFNVPDLRGFFMRGVSGTSGNDPDASLRGQQHVGANGGNNVGSVQADNFRTHHHLISDPGHTHNFFVNGNPSPSIYAGANANSVVPTVGQPLVPDAATVTIVSAATGISIQNNGGSETRPLNLYVNYIIKT